MVAEYPEVFVSRQIDFEFGAITAEIDLPVSGSGSST
jgi:hypothetical protein